MVALGTLLSTFWILSANSWMQTPVGHAIVDGRFVPDDWYRIVFNPSFPYRLVHTTIAFFITTAFVVIGVAAYHLRRERHVEESLVMQKIGNRAACGARTAAGRRRRSAWNQYARAPAGEDRRHRSALADAVTHAAAPVRMARRTSGAQPMGTRCAFAGLAHPHTRCGRYGARLEGVAAGGSSASCATFLLLPPMVGIGLVMLAIAVAGLALWRRGRLATSRRFQRLCMLAAPLGFIAVIAGWVTTEVGRQPWVVYGLLRTRDHCK